MFGSEWNKAMFDCAAVCMAERCRISISGVYV